MEYEKTIEIKYSKDLNGKVILNRVNAGVINRAKRVAFQSSKDSEERSLIMEEELLPHSIGGRHPWQTLSPREALKKMDYEDYKKLCKGLDVLMGWATEEITKNLGESSEEKSVQTGGSKTCSDDGSSIKSSELIQPKVTTV